MEYQTRRSRAPRLAVQQIAKDPPKGAMAFRQASL